MILGETQIYNSDCITAMAAMILDGVQIDSCVTDPPYHLTSVVKRFGGDGLYQRQSAGFMGKQWDGGDVAFQPNTWRLVYDLLKPGGHLVAFGGTRFFYRAKASKADRHGSKHPTVKPISLIKHLATMVTPVGGVALDPFAGSGTLAAAWSRSILIEREREYYNDILTRVLDGMARR